MAEVLCVTGSSKVEDAKPVTVRNTAKTPGPSANAAVSDAVHTPVNAPAWRCPVRSSSTMMASVSMA